jgi:hypothetical protein
MFCRGALPNKGIPPKDIPANPNQTYANKGWISMGDWLGTGAVAPRLRKYRSFSRARAFARSLCLKSTQEWIAFTQGRLGRKDTLPRDVPACPYQTYADKGWHGFADWLGTDRKRIAKRRQQTRFTQA